MPYYKYKYKQYIYQVPLWYSQLDRWFVSQRPGFESRGRLKFWKSLLGHEWNQKRLSDWRLSEI